MGIRVQGCNAWAIGTVGVFSQTHALEWTAAHTEQAGAAGSSEQLTCPIMASSGMGQHPTVGCWGSAVPPSCLAAGPFSAQ